VSPAISGLLGRESSPRALRRAGRRQLRKLKNVEIVQGLVLDASPNEDGVHVTVARDDGVAQVQSRALVLAHGLRYEPPEIPGLEKLWGKSVFHCVFCDGWEVSDKPIALHARGEGAARLALLMRGWSDDVLLCTDGPDGLGDEDRAQLAAAGVRIREERILRLDSRGKQLTNIVFQRGPAEARHALFVRPRRSQPSLLAERAGLEVGDDGLIPTTDASGRTEVDGVYVAGDSAAPVRSVAIAIGSGSRVGTAIAADLIVDRLAPPVSAARP
jgi:thioredoxin reductase